MSQEAAYLISKTLRDTYAEKHNLFMEFIKSRGDDKVYEVYPEVKFFNRHAYINHPTYGPYLLNGSAMVNFAKKCQLFFFKQTFLYDKELQIRIAKHELSHFFHYIWKGPEALQSWHNNDFMDISEIVAGERWDGAIPGEHQLEMNPIRIMTRNKWKVVPLRTVDNRRGYFYLSEPQPLAEPAKDRVA